MGARANTGHSTLVFGCGLEAEAQSYHHQHHHLIKVLLGARVPSCTCAISRLHVRHWTARWEPHCGPQGSRQKADGGREPVDSADEAARQIFTVITM